MRFSFDSFNARYTPEQRVAETFIDNGHYSRLCKPSHTIVLGPRGCGKTTLLKMLTVPAQSTWRRLHGVGVDLPFTAIYIPADVHFQDQLNHAEARFARWPLLKESISRAAVLTSVQIACVDSFLDRISYEKRDDPNREAQLSTHLIKTWQLPSEIPSLILLRLELHARIVLLGQIINSEYQKSPDLPDWAKLDPISTAIFGCHAFDTAYGLDRRDRWALCFDELELAPAWLLRALFGDLRSIDQKILLKLGTSPHPDVIAVGTASALNDFDPIKLWASSMVGQRRFCNGLAQQIITNRMSAAVTPESLLGTSSWFVDEDEESPGDVPAGQYERGSEEWQLILEEAREDPSLHAFLVTRGINPDDPTVPAGQLRDTVLRKVKPLVMFRRSLTKFNPVTQKRNRKSRKLRPGFFGIPAALDISDGNPRFLKRIFEEMCAAAESGPKATTPIVDRNAQSRILNTISLQFHNYIRGIPGSQARLPNGDQVYLFSILRSIGKWFSSRILLGEFTADPISSFIVNDDLPSEIVQLLIVASEHAAIVRIDDPDSMYDLDIRGKRYRLTYLLAPLCQLPLRNYDAVSLRKCFESSAALRRLAMLASPVASPEEFTLF